MILSVDDFTVLWSKSPTEDRKTSNNYLQFKQEKLDFFGFSMYFEFLLYEMKNAV